MIKKLILSVLLMSLISQASNAQDATGCAKDLGSCKLLLGQCSDVIDAKDAQINLCQLAVKYATGEAADIQAQLDTANSKLDSPFRNPFVMGAAGLVIGVVVMVLVKH